jgi:hypothetical protein
MKAFDETYADQDFQRQLDQARAGWMAGVPRAQQPDLNVEGLRGSLFARVVSALCGQRKAN